MDQQAWVATAYGVCISVAVLFALYAVAFGWWTKRKRLATALVGPAGSLSAAGRVLSLSRAPVASIGPTRFAHSLAALGSESNPSATTNVPAADQALPSTVTSVGRVGNAELGSTEDFVTARGTQSVGRIAWSFYAGAVGAWVIVSPSQYAAFAGIVGVVVYALTSGLPVLLIAALGGRITRAVPHVYSMSDFFGWRFGPCAKTLVALLCVFNMSIALLAEFTTMGALFQAFVGTVPYGIIIAIGALTILYTVYGGLVVSIATDQVQGIASICLAIVLVAWVGATHRTPLQSPLPPELGPNEYGYTSIFTLGLSLLASTVFSEAMWQRVWASSSRRVLHVGAGIGALMITAVVAVSGIGGWLALGSGVARAKPYDYYSHMASQTVNPAYKNQSFTDDSLYLFNMFGNVSKDAGPGLTYNARLSNAVGLAALVLATIMNESAVDSLQNGLAASISGQWLKGAPLWRARLGVIIINVPLIVIGARGYNVLSLFLVTNLACVCAFPGVIFGLIPRFRRHVTETGFLFSFVCGCLGLTGFGIGYYTTNAEGGPATPGQGATWAWYGNSYDWRCFLVALGSAVGGLGLWSLGAYGLRRAFGGRGGPGLTGLLMRVPGFRYVVGAPNWTPERDRARHADVKLRFGLRGEEARQAAAKATWMDGGPGAGGSGSDLSDGSDPKAALHASEVLKKAASATTAAEGGAEKAGAAAGAATNAAV